MARKKRIALFQLKKFCKISGANFFSAMRIYKELTPEDRKKYLAQITLYNLQRG